MSHPHPIHISKGDVKKFHEDGYLIYHHPVFPEDKFVRLKAFFENLLDNLPPGKRPEAMDVPHFAHPELFEWLLADEVLDLVEPFLGPNIALWSSHFICKPKGDGLAVPWHEDSAYWNSLLDRQEVVTVWLAIDDSTVENGCMRIIPKTHHHGFSDYEPVDRERHVFGSRVKPEQMDESTAVDCEIKAGEAHLHHAKLIHGSNANTSDKRRCGYTMRYMPTNIKHIVENRRWPHQIYLARGRDLGGNAYGDPTKQHVEGIR